MDRLLCTRLLALRRSAIEGTFVLIQRKRSMLAKQPYSNATIELSRALEHRSQDARDLSNEQDLDRQQMHIHQTAWAIALEQELRLPDQPLFSAPLQGLLACRRSLPAHSLAAAKAIARAVVHTESPCSRPEFETRYARFAIEFFLGRAVAFFSALRPNLHRLASRAVANRLNLRSRIGCFRRQAFVSAPRSRPADWPCRRSTSSPGRRTSPTCRASPSPARPCPDWRR